MQVKTFVTLTVGTPGAPNSIPPGEYDAGALKKLGVDVATLVKRKQAEELGDDADVLPEAQKTPAKAA